MKKYVRIMRIDHWIKQLFIVPGFVCCFLLTDHKFSYNLIINFVIGFLATSLIASANYVINEWLDAEFDKYHPIKKNRSVVTEDVKGSVVWTLWCVLSLAGFALSYFVSIPFMAMCIWLWIMGLLYNVKPFRTKDIVYLDVLSESLNNAIRFLMGWFMVQAVLLPPSSAVLGYWMAGAFLMGTKRFAEYRMINDPKTAGLYRKSFAKYSQKTLLISSFCYAMCSVFMMGVFLIKYKVEYLLAMPFLIGLFGYYFGLSFKEDSVVQKPEKLYREHGLMLYCLFLIILFTVLTFVKIPFLNMFVTEEMISLW